MADIAGIFLSPILQVFFDRIASCELVDLFYERQLSDKLLRKLRIALLTVNAVVEDAEDRQFTEPSVKLWLDELKDTIYDAEDILDKIASGNLRHKLGSEVGTISNQVQHSTSAPLFEVSKIEQDIKVAVEILEDLAKQIGVLGLRASVGGNPSETLHTTSLVDESRIYGRREDKKAIIESLLANDASGNEIIRVIAIVGMGGIGKTTLAQLVFNDNELKEHFDLKAWVCVSDDFDVSKLTKTILEEVGSPVNPDSKNLNLLQRNLEGVLKGKKFLVVLDDVWNKMFVKWECLSNAFKSGAQGSKVIVTTRDQEVASVMFASTTHCLNELPKEDSLLLFEKYAFQNLNLDARQEGKELGREIVEKCKGLPLAIKAIGSLLGSKSNVKEWGDVLRSELWDLPIEKTGILPALSLSYKHLSPHLRRCFAYCSIFPKDYAFKKDTVVLLWMAEGFLPQLQNKTMEEVGDDYFFALVSRSLFQRSNRDEYIMHDLVSNMAKFISKQFTLSHEDDGSCEIGSNTRHFSYSYKKFDSEKFQALQRAERLRTIVELNFFGGNRLLGRGTQVLLPMIRCLRVLILSHYGDITELEDSIGNLIHLRYLDLSYTRIESLPNSICKLCNLQILNLSRCINLNALPDDMHELISLQILNLAYCRHLVALPRDVDKLDKLRHLNIANTGIMEMPIDLGKLKCLQRLSTFIVSKHSGSSIKELGKLTNLQGSLSILELQNVEYSTDAKDVNLRDMKYLEKLVLEWKVDTDALESHKTVLDGLQPHSNLKSLTIKGYGGTFFPDWMGDASFSTSSLEKLSIKDCPKVESFREEGLPSNLNEIRIHNCDKLFASRMDWGLQGLLCVRRFSIAYESEDVKSFPDEGLLPKSLTYLRIKGFPNLESLDMKGLQHLTALEELEIRFCPKLKCMPEERLPDSLTTLRICNCPLLTRGWENKEGEEWGKIAHVPRIIY